MFFKFILSLSKIKDNFISNVPPNISGAIWDKTYSNLNEYNKTVTTLSSSALVLSFTAIQIGKLPINKPLVIASWIFFALVLIFGILIYFLNYLYAVASGIIEKNTGEKKYKNMSEFVKSEEALYYFETRSIMYRLSLAQLLCITAGLILLIIIASQTL